MKILFENKMKAIVVLLAILALAFWAKPTDAEPNLVCYYDSSNLERADLGTLDLALQFCTHLVYGYAGITPDTYAIRSLIENDQYSEIILIKRRHPHLKVLLSVGGDKDNDPDHPNKYIELLEGGRVKQAAFINSTAVLLRSRGFDGLDLAFQFPKNKPRKVHSTVGRWWKKFKKFFTGDFVVDEKADEHKQQFTKFVGDVGNILRMQNLMLTLTVLPNVNSSWYFDIPSIAPNLDFINLAAFDFLTPERNPEEADFTAPIYELHDQNRLGHYNLNFQVNHWLQRQCPPSKINVGIATYGRAWKMTTDSGVTGVPVVAATDGPAPAGQFSHTAGFLSWSEVCEKLPNPENSYLKGADAPLRRVTDPTRRYGPYAFRPVDNNGDHGMWVSYEDPDSASNKATYVRSKGLGGMAIFDLSSDDFRGKCTGDKYPILRAAKYRLL